MKVGVLGGTFDPPHNGHLALAQAGIDALELDEVIFLPASRNPLKIDKPTASKHRMEMLKRAILGHPGFSLSDLEIDQRAPSFAVDSMQQLQAVRPAQYWFLIGSDALRDFAGWKQPEKLVRLCRLGVAERSREREYLLASLPEYALPAIDWVPMKPVDISASELRHRIGGGRPASQWIPQEVEEYIESNHLYR